MQYGATIFQSAGIDDPILIQLVLGAVNVATTFPGLYIVERVGRRIPLIVGACWQATWLLIFAAVGIARPPDQYESSGIVMIVAACMFIASFAMTWYVVSLHPLPGNIHTTLLTALLQGSFRLGRHWRDLPPTHPRKASLLGNRQQLARQLHDFLFDALRRLGDRLRFRLRLLRHQHRGRHHRVLLLV